MSVLINAIITNEFFILFLVIALGLLILIFLIPGVIYKYLTRK